MWLVVRLEWIRSENTNAHRATAKNIDEVKKNIDDVKQDVRMLIKHLRERKPAAPDT